MCATVKGEGVIREHARTLVTSQIPVTNYVPPATVNVYLNKSF